MPDCCHFPESESTSKKRMIEVVPNCLQLRGRVVHCYALLEPDTITLIDGGFLTMTPNRIAAELAKAGRDLAEVSRILLTHGHIDHTLNIAGLKRLSGARVWAPRLEADHIEGRYPYRGLSRLCGWMEAATRRMFRYEAPKVDEWFSPGEMIEAWGGLEIIPLPGHTLGHVGFYSPERKLLFAADLFANFYHYAKLPPPWFNVDRASIGESLKRADALDLAGGVLLSHCHRGPPSAHRRDLSKLATRV